MGEGLPLSVDSLNEPLISVVLVSCSPGKLGNAGATILPSAPRPPLSIFGCPSLLLGSSVPLLCFWGTLTLGSTLKRGGDRDLPGCPVAKTLPSSAGGGFNPCPGS